MKRSRMNLVQALLENSFQPLERTKEGLLLGGFSEIAALAGNNCNCYGATDNCDCYTGSAGNNCQCGTNTTERPTQVLPTTPTTCGLFL